MLGHVGSFVPKKNQRFLVEVFQDVLKRCPDAVLCLVGDGPERKAVEDEAHNLGLQDRVIFTGVVDDISRKMMHVFDAFALPSWHEGLPLVLLEAQAAGLRCVISDRVAEEVIVDAQTFTCVSLLDRGAWVDAVVAALCLPRARRPGIAGMAGGQFDIETSVRALEAIYLRLIQGRVAVPVPVS